MHYVYVLQNKERAYYIGCTNSVERRLAQHDKGKPGFALVYYEAYRSSLAAKQRERKLKQYGSAWRGIRKRIETA